MPKKKAVVKETSESELNLAKPSVEPVAEDIDADETNAKKKRGRRPKDKVYNSLMSDVDNSFGGNDENIIISLPITLDDLRKEETNIITNIQYQPPLEEPFPYVPTDYFKENFSPIEKLNGDCDVGGQISEKNTIIYIKDKDIIQTDDGEEKILVKRDMHNILFEFINANEKDTWVTSTSVYCYWCCHPFSNVPCALPVRYESGKFYLMGCFCSFNCAAAYNFEYHTYNMWERYSLLNLLYKTMYQTPYIKIKIAPPKEILKIFGGFETIDNFRRNFLTLKAYDIVYPPMISIIPRIEENIFVRPFNENSMLFNSDDDGIYNSHSTPVSTVPTVKTGGTNAGGGLKLKRNKPLTNPNNTLESYMSIKVI